MNHSADEKRMTRAERTELAGVVRLRAKVARADVDARKAELLADFEAQLAARYQVSDARWNEIANEAQRAVDAADAKIASVCTEFSVPPEFRPGLSLSWHGRGENAFAGRRAELRKVATSRLDAQAAAAKAEIDRREASLRADLAARGLVTLEAQEWLAQLPNVAEQLLPRLDLSQIEEARPIVEPRLGMW
jgi:hypothetical protein